MTEEEKAVLQTAHSMQNGHTFVPHDDTAMEAALKLAEQCGGKFPLCIIGILPLRIEHVDASYKRNRLPDFPDVVYCSREHITIKWEIDKEYWNHCRHRWAYEFPLAIATIDGALRRQFSG